MNSGTHGSKNERGETLLVLSEQKPAEERQMIKLLSLVSNKINERFVDLKTCFRHLDTNHSQSISINEFAQAIEHMRLKISFDDVKKLFNYLDKTGKGEIGYEEFTMLLEERWRGIDPIEDLKTRLAGVKNPM
jgi:Ca2+-binding EF-hand superfamily protein